MEKLASTLAGLSTSPRRENWPSCTYRYPEKDIISLTYGPARNNTWPELNHKETSNKSKVKRALKTKQLFFKIFTVTEDKRSPKNCFRLKETEETWQLNA